MGVTYDRFLQSGIDLSTLDIRAGDNSPYFCTPRGASIIGWTVNSVHFCFVHGCGETVFSVSPRAAAPDFLRAVARDFDSFLRLLLSCGSAAVLEQGARYPKEIFESNLEHAFLSEEARTTLAAIADTFRLDPMPSPWDYMSELHQGFDYSAIAFTDPDCAPAEPGSTAWAVTFGGGRLERPGREISLDRHFAWAGREWAIPAVYECALGLVVDVCMRANPDDVRAFYSKWGTQEREFTRQEQEAIRAENPFIFDYSCSLTLNQDELPHHHSIGSGWFSGLWEERGWAAAAVEHYGLDPDSGWQVSRLSFSWAGRRRPRIESLSVTLDAHPAAVHGEAFTVSAPGDTAVLINPETEEPCILTVCEYEPKVAEDRDGGGWEYPRHSVAMSYTLSPDPGPEVLHINDCCEGSQPRPTGVSGEGRTSPQYSFYLVPNLPDRYCTFSSRYFDPPEQIEWQPTFMVKRHEPFELTLI